MIVFIIRFAECAKNVTLNQNVEPVCSEETVLSFCITCVSGTDATHAEHIETIKSRMYVGLTADQRFLPGELGMGLVEGTETSACRRYVPMLNGKLEVLFFHLGYNSMGYEMSKPNLRSELEADLKLVSEGRKDKHSVLQHHIQKYKTVFIESVRKAKRFVRPVFL